MSYILGFDVSNNSCSVAVSNGQNILSLVEELRPHMQAEHLLPLINLALKKAGIDFNQLQYLAATQGPGSFTGIRIGLATAKAICFASNVVGVGITNFEFWHARALEQVKNYSKIVVIINAYRNQLYYQEFDQNGLPSVPQLLDATEAITFLQHSPAETVVAGSGLEVIYASIYQSTNLQLLPRFSRVRAVQICRIADKKIKRNSHLASLEPLYIRPPDAKNPSDKKYK
jgi:tRNA threonylcarbamoyladenosine biosynthesis protein TsaB